MLNADKNEVAISKDSDGNQVVELFGVRWVDELFGVRWVDDECGGCWTIENFEPGSDLDGFWELMEKLGYETGNQKYSINVIEFLKDASRLIEQKLTKGI